MAKCPHCQEGVAVWRDDIGAPPNPPDTFRCPWCDSLCDVTTRKDSHSGLTYTELRIRAEVQQ